MYHLEGRSVSTANRYKDCPQILVLSVNKSPIRYTFRNATESYTVQYEHDFKLGVVKDFVNFTGKRLCWSTFLIKMQGSALQLY